MCGMMVLSLAIGLALIPGRSQAQKQYRGKNIFFPSPMYDRKWLPSFGFVTIATPTALTEEFQLRVPAGDVQLLRQLHGGFHLNTRAQVQILQNHISLGMRWAEQLEEKWSFSIGGDIGYFRGVLDLEGYDTEARGWDAFPNFSLGLRTGRKVTLTFKTDAILNLDYHTRVGDVEITRELSRFNGMAWSLYLEQPFFGQTNISLGFTARYTNFFWATWALFDPNERAHLFRQITVSITP